VDRSLILFYNTVKGSTETMSDSPAHTSIKEANIGGGGTRNRDWWPNELKLNILLRLMEVVLGKEHLDFCVSRALVPADFWCQHIFWYQPISGVSTVLVSARFRCQHGRAKTGVHLAAYFGLRGHDNGFTKEWV
jgi:hypothetical protein